MDFANCCQPLACSLLCKRLLRTLKRLCKLLDLKPPATSFSDCPRPAKSSVDILLECVALAVRAVKKVKSDLVISNRYPQQPHLSELPTDVSATSCKVFSKQVVFSDISFPYVS